MGIQLSLFLYTLSTQLTQKRCLLNWIELISLWHSKILENHTKLAKPSDKPLLRHFPHAEYPQHICQGQMVYFFSSPSLSIVTSLSPWGLINMNNANNSHLLKEWRFKVAIILLLVLLQWTNISKFQFVDLVQEAHTHTHFPSEYFMYF